MLCNNCKKQNEDGIRFCIFCGSALMNTQSPAPEPNQAPPRQEPVNNPPYAPNPTPGQFQHPQPPYPDKPPYNAPQPPSAPAPQPQKRVPAALIVTICVTVALLAVFGVFAALFLTGVIKIPGSAADTQPTAAVTEQPTSGVNTGDPGLLTTPDITGMKSSTAHSLLDSMGLIYFETFENSDSIPEGYVISQYPAAGDPVPKGGSVAVFISSGPAKPSESSGGETVKYLYCCASDFVTLRKTPSRSGSEITKITTREAMENLGRDGEYYYVSYKGQKGYVLADFVSEDINAPLNYGTGNP